MIYVAEAINFSNSELLALMQGFTGVCMTIPVLLAGYLSLKSKTVVYRKLYFLALSMFLLNLIIFGLLSGVGTRFTDSNLIDTSSWIFWIMLIVLVVSVLGITASLLLLVVEWFKNRKSTSKRKV